MIGGSEFQEPKEIDWETALTCQTISEIRVIIRRAGNRKIVHILSSGIIFNDSERQQFLRKVVAEFRELHQHLKETLLLELEAERY